MFQPSSKPIAVNRCQPGVNPRSTWGQPRVNLGSTWGRRGVSMGWSWGGIALAHLDGKVLRGAAALAAVVEHRLQPRRAGGAFRQPLQPRSDEPA